jgi:hypothetical protein
VFVSQIIDEAKQALGKCDLATVYKRISDALKLANHQGKFDVAIGMMDLCVCDGCVTLPADVATVLAVSNGGYPTLIRDQWYQFHANGSGSDCCVPCGYTDELGPFCTFKDPPGPVTLVGELENALDTGCSTLRVFGWDENGKRIYTPGPNGVLEDGFLIPLIYGFAGSNPDAPSIARIDRIQKSVTNGFVRLLATDPTTGESQTLIGHYLPWETVPTYRRLKVPDRSWLRIKYRRKDIEVTSSSDWINIENREALLLLLKAVKYRMDNQLDLARNFELEGMRLLSNEAEALRPPGPQTPQIVMDWPIPGTNPYDTLFF